MNILRKLISISLILSLALFEVGQSIQMNSAFSQTDIGVSTTVGSEGKAVKMKSENMFAANRWINTVALLMVASISILAGKMCFDNRKKKTGINCGLSTISLGVAGISLLTGYIWSFIEFQDQSFSKIHVSGLKNDGSLEDDSKLAQYGALCKKIQEEGYDLGGKTPDQIQQDLQGNGWPVPGGATGESITLYCDQYGSLKVQKNVLQNMLDGLLAEFIFLLAAEAAILTAFGIELYEALEYWKRETLWEKTVGPFLVTIGKYIKAIHAFNKTFLGVPTNPAVVSDGLVAIQPCHIALHACKDYLEQHTDDRSFYNSQILTPVILDGSEKVPLCGQKGKVKIESYRDMINFCIHATWTCEKSLAQISTLKVSKTIAAGDCTTSGGTQAKPRRGYRCARKSMTPAQVEAQNARIEADNVQRRIVRKEHKARRAREAAGIVGTGMTPAEFNARVEIGNIDKKGKGLKMGRKQTDMNTRISLLHKLQTCELTDVVETCDKAVREAPVEIPALAAAEKTLHPLQKTLQKFLPKLMAGTKEAKCSLDEVRRKRLETYDAKIKAAIEKLKFGGSVESAKATATTKPAVQRDKVQQAGEDVANASDKASGSGCAIACSDPKPTGAPSTVIFKNNDDQLWNSLIESVINSAYAKKNEESITETNNVWSGVIGLVGIGAAAFGILLQKTGTFQKLFHKTPGTRMGWIGGMIALVGGAIATNRVAASQVKDDISKLDTIISEATGGEGGGSLPLGDDPPDEEDPEDPDPDPDPEEGPDIAETSGEDSSMTNPGRPGGGDSGGVFSGGSNFNIKDLALAPPKLKIFVGASRANSKGGASAASASKPVPGQQEVENFGNEVQAGELKGQQNIKALAARAKKLSSKKSLIQKFVDKAKKQLNAVLQRSGQKPIDFKKRSQLALASIMGPIKNSKNPKIQAALKETPMLAAVSPDSMKSYAPSTPNLPDYDSFESSTSASMDYGSGSSDLEVSPPENLSQVDKDLGELEIKMESINNRKDISIFKVISRRYFRSAYPVFFKKK